ncbi:MAG: carbohydrate kinase [Candidatus Heimdallarchaeota archaeon]|nr:carbohydrate kinase [Candidatus Heimdallarchaeota archaeon]
MIFSIGEVLIDFLSDEIVSLEKVKAFKKYPGGAPANFAVGIARLGLDITFIGVVGNDPFGEYLISFLNTEGVNTNYIDKAHNNEQTALAFISLDDVGERNFIFYRNNAADLTLSPEKITSDIFNECEYLHFGTLSLSAEPSKSATLKAILECKKKGGKICFDPNLRMDVWKSEKVLRETILQVLLYVDILYPSYHELSFILGKEMLEKEAINELMEKYPLEIIALKKGKDGCLIKSRDDYFLTIPSFDVSVIDTTGAGDGFNVGFIYGLSTGKTLEEAGILGNAIGALVIQKRGAMTSLPTQNELKEFLINQRVTLTI